MPHQKKISQAWWLRHGRSRRLVRVMPEDNSPLYRVIWPDIGPSEPVNLARAMEAAEWWAEQQMLIELRKKRGVAALKFLDKFSWSASSVRSFGPRAVSSVRVEDGPSGSAP
jgi:hypothetical protein